MIAQDLARLAALGQGRADFPERGLGGSLLALGLTRIQSDENLAPPHWVPLANVHLTHETVDLRGEHDAVAGLDGAGDLQFRRHRGIAWGGNAHRRRLGAGGRVRRLATARHTGAGCQQGQHQENDR